MATGLVIIVALWVEFRPDPTIEHPFATSPIQPGEEITSANTELRKVPVGIFDQVVGPMVATSDIAQGDPILVSDTGVPGSLVPSEWWVVGVALPGNAARGDSVRIVLLETGAVVPGVVSETAGTDPLDASTGGVAVAPLQTAEVARAAATGQVAVLVETG